MPSNTIGLTVDGTSLAPAEEPMRVSHCTFTGLATGITLLGMNTATKKSTPMGRLLICDNRFEECTVGIWATGQLNDTLIAGNRFLSFFETGIRLADLHDGTKGTRIANNTINSHSAPVNAGLR